MFFALDQWLGNMRKAHLAYSPSDSICIYLMAFSQIKATQTYMIPDVGHRIPRHLQTVTAWIHCMSEEEIRGLKNEIRHQISRLSSNTPLAINGKILTCSDSELLFYLHVMLSIWITYIKTTTECYDWLIHTSNSVCCVIQYLLHCVKYYRNSDFCIGHPVCYTAL